MHIKQIILDGFKSYANRTVVPDFDPQFNAITGLNGSGKSNILDAICFVLGITQLGQVRVSNLQGLVYKHGQSGVTKASVTIVFDNSDPKCSPVGYEHEKEITVIRQVVIGGRNKYMINGHTAQASQVQNLFHSVQLNVNNPHFLIMQGRITKVLNMKPPEILGMIEEAAGTSMYERKKVSAEKKMEQKQSKVNEIEKILGEEITPKLEKLRNEKQTYLKWSQQNTEVERLERFCVAYNYSTKKEIVSSTEDKYNQLNEKIGELEGELGDLRKERNEIKSREKEFDGGSIKKLEKQVEKLQEKENECSRVLVKHESTVTNRVKTHEKLMAKDTEMKQRLTTLEEESKELEEKSTKHQEELIEVEASFNTAKKQYDNAQLGLQAANAGLDSSDASENSSEQRTLEETLVALRTTAQEAATTIKQNKLKMKHVTKELKDVQKQVKAAAKQDTQLEKELEKHTKNVADLDKQLGKLKYDPQEAQAVQEQLDIDQQNLYEVKDLVEKIGAELTAFDFDFESPSKSFDRSSVKGMVAKLIQLPDLENSTALEVVAGGKLYQVVVDTVNTGKALLEKGKLRKRVTIIPLDKVNGRTIPDANLKVADKIARDLGGSAKSALSLVGYDDELHRAMEYVFGTTLVCDSLETARAVTFDKRVKVRSVTLEGDSFDPQGTLSGGSRPSHGSVLVQLSKLHSAQEEMTRLEQSVREKTAQLKEWEAISASYQKHFQQRELAQHELDLVQARAKDTPYAQLLQKETALSETLASLEQDIERAEKLEQESKEKSAQVELDMKDMDAARKKLVSKAQEVLKNAKVQLEKADGEYNAKRDECETIALEIDQMKQERESILQGMKESESNIKKLAKEIEQLRKESESLQNDLEEAKRETNIVRDELDEKLAELNAMSTQLNETNAKIQARELEVKEIDTERKRVRKSAKEAGKELKALLSNHPWITTEEQFFGKPHTDYDFNARSPEAAKKKLRQLQEAQSKVSGTINKKVMGMIGKAEQEYEDLNRKRAIIEKDRQTIERVIKGLDKKKNEAVRATWEKVNKDFGSIFSTLLPGTMAKLDPPEDGTIHDGLEVKVAFGKTWKKSLTELSGGQRSLLALSLILALLLFKPAPMYILDEVDAALDLSHTQNIGQMLRTHFAHSQFIVVSLKEGMFNNANVIFRTKFVDGVSCVTRTSNREHVARLENHASKAAAVNNASKKRRQRQVEEYEEDENLQAQN